MVSSLMEMAGHPYLVSSTSEFPHFHGVIAQTLSFKMPCKYSNGMYVGFLLCCLRHNSRSSDTVKYEVYILTYVNRSGDMVPPAPSPDALLI